MDSRDIFSRHGIDYVMSIAQEEVEWFFSEAEEIGTSDVSCCVRAIYDKLDVNPDRASEVEVGLIRNLVHNLISELPRNEYA
jgi:hypothetical protein